MKKIIPLLILISAIVLISGCVQQEGNGLGPQNGGGPEFIFGDLDFVEGDSESWHIGFLDTGLSLSWFRFDYLNEGPSLRCGQFGSLEDAQNNVDSLGEAVVDYVGIPPEGYLFTFGEGASSVIIRIGILNFPPTGYAIYKYEIIPESKEDDMAVVAQAREDIELYRKGYVILTVVDSQGQQYSEVEVSYAQAKHSFLFGFFNYGDYGVPAGSKRASVGENADVLITPMEQAGFNSATHMMNWKMQEPESGVYDFDGRENSQETQSFHQAGLIGIGYSLYMTASVPEFVLVPPYAFSLSFEELKEAVYPYVCRAVEYYKNEIKIWNVFNEPIIMETNALNLDEQQQIEIIKEGVQAIHDADPEAQIMINVWPPGGEFAYIHPYDFFQDAIDAEVDFDIIGLEWYYNSYGATYWGGGPFIRRNLTSSNDVIDLYSALGKKVFISEISVPSEAIGQGYWGQPWSEELQAEYLEAAYTIFFSKPQVIGIGYWDVIDRGAFIYHGGLLDEQDEPKEAYYTLKNLIENWTTTGTGITDENGQVTFRGFGGAYEVVVSNPETGLSMQQEIIIEEQKNNVFTLVLG